MPKMLLANRSLLLQCWIRWKRPRRPGVGTAVSEKRWIFVAPGWSRGPTRRSMSEGVRKFEDPLDYAWAVAVLPNAASANSGASSTLPQQHGEPCSDCGRRSRNRWACYPCCWLATVGLQAWTRTSTPGTPHPTPAAAASRVVRVPCGQVAAWGLWEYRPECYMYAWWATGGTKARRYNLHASTCNFGVPCKGDPRRQPRGQAPDLDLPAQSVPTSKVVCLTSCEGATYHINPPLTESLACGLPQRIGRPGS